jgi:hypothetical protein
MKKKVILLLLLLMLLLKLIEEVRMKSLFVQVFTVMAAAVLLPTVAVQAQGAYSRGNTWDLYIGPQYVMGETLRFDGGARAEIDDSASLLFGFGYHPNKALSFDFMFSSASADYVGIAKNAIGEERRFTSDMDSSSFSIGATYYLLPGRFTPFVSALIGYTYIDSGIENGEYYESCWWDPWYGYYCSPYADTYSSSDFSYGGAVGVRYDFPSHFFLKATAGITDVDLDVSGSSTFTYYNLLAGISFE